MMIALDMLGGEPGSLNPKAIHRFTKVDRANTESSKSLLTVFPVGLTVGYVVMYFYDIVHLSCVVFISKPLIN